MRRDPLMPDEDYELQAKREVAAALLAIASSRLRDADDALVTHGRAIREGSADRGMPEDDEGTIALGLCNDVGHAYVEMRRAEAEWEKVRGG